MSNTISRQSAEVLNETRGIEDSIMLALTLNENMGDQDPSIDWRPGDPLFDYPLGTLGEEQHVRPMFELMADGDFRVPMHMNTCEVCEVMWHEDTGLACWNCGEEGVPSAYGRMRGYNITTASGAHVPIPPDMLRPYRHPEYNPARSYVRESFRDSLVRLAPLYAVIDVDRLAFSAAMASSRSLIEQMYGTQVLSVLTDELIRFEFSFSERDVEPYVPPTLPTSLFQMAKDVDVELDLHRRYASVCRRTVTGEVVEQRFENVVGAAEIHLQKPVPVTDVLDRLRTSSGSGWRGIDCQNGGNRGPEVAGRSLWGN